MERNELRPVVRTYELRFAMFRQHWVQCVENIVRSHLRSYSYAQRLTGVFIQNRQHFVTAPIAELIVNEVDGPDMVGVCGPQPYDRAVLMIKPPPLLMPVGQL